MSSGSSLDSQVHGSQLQEHLGRPIGPPLVLHPKPLQFDWVSAVLVGAVLGLLATTIRLIWAPEGWRFVLAYGIVTLALVSGPAALLVLRHSRRATLVPFERGLAFTFRDRKRTVLYEQLKTLALKEREVSGGMGSRGSRGSRGMLRRVTFVDEQGRLEFEHFSRGGVEDRLGFVLVHLMAFTVEHAERKLQAGGLLAGQDWSLGPKGLRVLDEPPVPIAEIGAVTVRRQRVAVWKPGDRFPFFVLPDDSPNALVLVGVLSRRLEERGERLF